MTAQLLVIAPLPFGKILVVSRQVPVAGTALRLFFVAKLRYIAPVLLVGKTGRMAKLVYGHVDDALLRGRASATFPVELEHHTVLVAINIGAEVFDVPCLF